MIRMFAKVRVHDVNCVTNVVPFSKAILAVVIVLKVLWAGCKDKEQFNKLKTNENSTGNKIIRYLWKILTCQDNFVPWRATVQPRNGGNMHVAVIPRTQAKWGCSINHWFVWSYRQVATDPWHWARTIWWLVWLISLRHFPDCPSKILPSYSL